MKQAHHPVCNLVQLDTTLSNPHVTEFIELFEDSDRRQTKFQGFFITRVGPVALLVLC